MTESDWAISAPQLSEHASEPGDGQVQVHHHLLFLGSRIRQLRGAQGLTLADMAGHTGLSVSMVSAVERGRANPSIGTIITIAEALKVPVGALFGVDEPQVRSPVIRREEQPVLAPAQGMRRRVIVPRRGTHGLEMVLSDYAPGTANNPTPHKHSGYEIGLVLQGELQVNLSGQSHLLRTGDAIAYSSGESHRFSNAGPALTRVIWVNLYEPR